MTVEVNDPEVIVKSQDQVNIQREWDRLLIDRFYSANTLKMYIVSYIFIRNFGITEKQFYELKRVPRSPGQRNVYGLRFVCAFLPKIAEILWRHKAEEIEILADAMCKIKYDVDKIEMDYEKITRDRGNIDYAKRKFRSAALSHHKSSKLSKGFNRNKTWNVTK